MCSKSNIIYSVFLENRQEPSGGFHAHLMKCHECRKTFNTLCDVERTLSRIAGTDAGISDFEKAFLPSFDELFGSAYGSEPVKKEGFWERLNSMLSWRFLVPASAVIIFAFAAVLYFSVLKKDEFVPRTAETKPFIELFCVNIGEEGSRIIRESSLFSDIPVCRTKDELMITYVNPDPRRKYLNAFALSEDGDIIWYYPNPVRQNSFEIEKTERLAPLKTTTRLWINHHKGKYKMFVFFCGESTTFGKFKDFTSDYMKMYPEKELSMNKCVQDVISFELE